MPPKRQKAGVALHQDLQLYEKRLATFQSAYNPHRRNSAINKKQVLTWPIPDLSIEKLAAAGFYYRPTIANQDNCVCYLCDKALDGWEEGDNPAEEHIRHAPYCGWAIIHSMMVDRKKGRKVKLQDPNGEFMTNARKMTFGNWWPHEGKRGWVPTVDAMVAAGFHYIPSEGTSDKVGCAYCDLELDEWQQNDNPWMDHHERSPKCMFFLWVEGATSNQKPNIPATDELAKNLDSTLGKPKKRAPAAPKGRKRTNSNASTMSATGGSRKKKEEPPAADTAPDAQTEPPVKRKREKAPARTGRKRAGSNSSVMSENAPRRGRSASRQDEEEHPAAEPEAVAEKPKKRAPAAPRAGRKRAGSNASVMHEDERHNGHDAMDQDEPPPPPETKPRKRAPAAPKRPRRAGSVVSNAGSTPPVAVKQEPQVEEPKPRKRAPAAPKRPRRAGSVLSQAGNEEQQEQLQVPESPQPAPVGREPEVEKQTARKRAPPAPKRAKRAGSVMSLVDNEERRPQFEIPESPPPVSANREPEEEERKPRKRAPAPPKARTRGTSRTRSQSRTRTGGPPSRTRSQSRTRTGGPTYVKPELATFGDKRTEEERSQQASKTESFLSQFIRPASKTPVLSRESSREVSPARSEVGASGMRMFSNFSESFVEEAPPSRAQVMKKIRTAPELRPQPRKTTPEPIREPEPEPEPAVNRRKKTKDTTKAAGKKPTREVEEEEATSDVPLPKNFTLLGRKSTKSLRHQAATPEPESDHELRPLRQDSDGGMVLFDGGHDTDTELEDEAEEPPMKERTGSVNSDGSLGKRKRAELLNHRNVEMEEASEPKKHKTKAKSKKAAPSTTRRSKEQPDVEMTDSGIQADYHDPAVSDVREIEKPRGRGSRSALNAERAKPRKDKEPTPVPTRPEPEPEPVVDHEMTDVEPPTPKPEPKKSKTSLLSEKPKGRKPKSPTPVQHRPPSPEIMPEVASTPKRAMSIDGSVTPRPGTPMDEDLPSLDEADMLAQQQLIQEASTAGMTPSPQRPSPQQTPRRSFHREGSIVVHPDSLPLHRSSSSPLKQENSPHQSLRHVTSSPLVNAPVLAPPQRMPSTPPFHTPEPSRHHTPTPAAHSPRVPQSTPPHHSHVAFTEPAQPQPQHQLPWSPIDLDSFLDKVEESTEIANFDLANTESTDVDGLLTAEERNMTVEEWVKYNALLAEKRVLEACERMVQEFEREGRRAIECLERSLEVDS
ncbi:hypothetical protein BJ508DRAFT_415435 [Ascobolus immersus RN42]|uniref:BIR-domain-containing protein n=1 Tax=Ascobolus immersus RN42 TaxID=1160509 RepID=A0A3N4I8D9_ASCIM|nr:hypothetical protein BJ508DRAFT_415435 [Ascobolus immersus RN42]